MKTLTGLLQDFHDDLCVTLTNCQVEPLRFHPTKATHNGKYPTPFAYIKLTPLSAF